MKRIDEEREEIFSRFINTCTRWNNTVNVVHENRDGLPGAFIEGIYYGKLELINELIMDMEDIEAIDLLHVLVAEAMRVVALGKKLDIKWIKCRYNTWKELNGIE